jgi:hypothetical protein
MAGQVKIMKTLDYKRGRATKGKRQKLKKREKVKMMKTLIFQVLKEEITIKEGTMME